ncbi:hypothetical protein N431DRAFT_426285 [Stipitochalara longipes BDJ]|nr:hypothetical protein N431DRAFT_426285 [Stipitochalara longipes BDJ]
MDLQPTCAQPCISSAMLAVGCRVNDQSCGCRPALQQSIGNLAASCLIANCPATALVDIDNAGKAGCAAYSLTYMYSNVPSTMVSATISLTSSVPSPTGAISSSALGTVVRVTGSSSSSPTTLSAPTSGSNPASNPASRLSTGTIVGVGIVSIAVFLIIAFAIFCCLRHRRVNLRALTRSDSELFALVSTPELETKSIRHEMLARRLSPSADFFSRNNNRTSIYELSSEDSLLTEPAPLARVARRSQDEMDEVLRRDATVLGEAKAVKMERKPPQIVVHLADQPRTVQKARRLRKVEKVTSLRELKLGKETLDWD